MTWQTLIIVTSVAVSETFVLLVAYLWAMGRLADRKSNHKNLWRSTASTGR